LETKFPEPSAGVKCAIIGCDIMLAWLPGLPSYFRPKKKPVVPVSYREKIRVGRSEINFFLNSFFHFFDGRFAVESRHQY
jgi:hypothetical protein